MAKRSTEMAMATNQTVLVRSKSALFRRTIAGVELKAAQFASWNERMFRRYGNDRMYHHPSWIIRKIQQKRISTILRLLDLQPGDSLLDVGCGEGHLFSKVSPCGRCAGVDLSPTALRIAAQRNSRPEWVMADAEHMPFPAASFDKICCSEMIEHVIDPDAVLRELRRLLKPSGKLVITVPNEKFINAMKDCLLRHRLGRQLFPGIPLRTEWHLTEYTPALLRSHLQPYFTVMRAQSIPSFLCPLGYAVLCQNRRMDYPL
jgi:ubiquinone/menaquinone biosynthesis C-methylase UbiE